MIEREFLLELIRWGLALKADGKEGALPGVPEGLVWQTLVDEASRQGMAAVACDGLQRLYDAGMYEAGESRKLKAQWFAQSIRYEQRYARQWNAAVKMASWFADAGIRTYVLKGFIVSECYPVPSHRYCADMDCYLAAGGQPAYEAGNRIVEKRGIRVSRSYYKNSAYDLPGLHVENHRFCTPFRGNRTLRRLERLLQEMLRSGEGAARIDDTALYRPGPLFSALFLTEHGYSHFLHEGLTLRHVMDWMQFRRAHAGDVDWDRFRDLCGEFGFSRFLDALEQVGERVLGERTEEDLTEPARRMLEDIWKGPALHPGKRGLRARISLAGNTLHAAWKYRLFSDLSMPRALLIQVKGYLFDRHPEI